MNSACQAYNPQTCGVVHHVSQSLPFTGLDVTLLVAFAVAMLVAGLMIRRLAA